MTFYDTQTLSDNQVLQDTQCNILLRSSMTPERALDPHDPCARGW